MVERLRLNVPDMACEGCAESVRNALMSESGVSEVNVNLDTKLVDVDYDSDKTTPETLRKRVENTGYNATIS